MARKVERIGGDLGSVNEVIDAEIQGHFLPRSRAAIGGTRSVAKGGAAAVHETLAGSLRLNRELSHWPVTMCESASACTSRRPRRAASSTPL